MSEKELLKSIDSRLKFIEISICVSFGVSFGWFVLYPLIEAMF